MLLRLRLRPGLPARLLLGPMWGAAYYAGAPLSFFVRQFYGLPVSAMR